MTCTPHTHGHVVAGGRCVYCGEVLQASGVLAGPYGQPGPAWRAAPFLDATDGCCRHGPNGCHQPSDAMGACAGCGTQLVALADEQAGYRSRLVWFELPTTETARPND